MTQRQQPLPSSGFTYVRLGCHLVCLPGIRRYVIVPLLINILLLGTAFYWLFTKLHQWIPQLMSYVPHWLAWLNFVLWPLAVISIVLVFGYFFSTLANWIAAPFFGLLAEQLEQRLTGHTPDDMSWWSLIADLPRIMKREWLKLCYYLPRAIGLLLIHFIPGVGQLLAPILWFIFGAWMMAIQYCDYPFDNHKIAFENMRRNLAGDRKINLEFGGLISVLTMIPIINLVIMPIAVCGATALWVDRYRQTLINNDRL